MNKEINLTSKTHPKAPAVICLGDNLVSASDYGHSETRKLLDIQGFFEEDIDKIMAARTQAKVMHAYKEEVIRRTGERYFDHPSGVALLLLLELQEIDPDVLSAAQLHDVLEDVKINIGELKNLLKRSTSPETLRIVQMVTNPEKTGDETKDMQIKKRHYHIISQDQKASRLKVGDRMYNLRCLEIIHFDIALITDKHIKTAEKQIQETKEYILPIAEKYGLGTKLLSDIEKVENQVSKVRLLLLQKDVKDAVVV